MIIGTSIEFITNLAISDFYGAYYDLHNDYICNKLYLEKDILRLIFTNIHEKSLLAFRFNSVEIIKIDFFNSTSDDELIVDLIYRGRAEVDGKLVESQSSKGYFYIDFVEGQKLELWAESIEIERF